MASGSTREPAGRTGRKRRTKSNGHSATFARFLGGSFRNLEDLNAQLSQLARAPYPEFRPASLKLILDVKVNQRCMLCSLALMD